MQTAPEYIKEMVLEQLRQLNITVVPDEVEVPVSVSGRHIHLSREHLEILFGRGAELRVYKEISQPGQFASEQFVSLRGPQGEIPKLRVLGPERKETQVELAMSEARRIGLSPPVRQSGRIGGTPGVRLTGPAGSVILDRGVIIAERHIHMTPAQASLWGYRDGQVVDVEIDTPKGGILGRVAIRIREDFALDMHVDTDDANAFLIPEGCRGKILPVNGKGEH